MDDKAMDKNVAASRSRLIPVIGTIGENEKPSAASSKALPAAIGTDATRTAFEAWRSRNEYDITKRLDGSGYNNTATAGAYAAVIALSAAAGDDLLAQADEAIDMLLCAMRAANWEGDAIYLKGTTVRAAIAAAGDEKRDADVIRLKVEIGNLHYSQAIPTSEYKAMIKPSSLIANTLCEHIKDMLAAIAAIKGDGHE